MDFFLQTVISPPTVWIAYHNSTTAIVKWLPPAYGKHSVEEYHLFYVQMQDHSMEKGPFIVDKRQKTYTLHGLSKLEKWWQHKQKRNVILLPLNKLKQKGVPPRGRNLIKAESVTNILDIWYPLFSCKTIAKLTANSGVNFCYSKLRK